MKTGDIVVDRYRLEHKLGMGGMGTVWAAEHIQTGRLFALKIMHATVAANEDSRQRFLKEAKASARIGHPSVIDVLDVGELPDGALFMAMELLDGLALVDALRLEPPLSVRELLLVLRDSSLALAAAHAVGIVHRDIKPANIFLHRDKATGVVRPKVLDFGVSKFAFLEESATQTGSLLGSPRYMSPEQARSAAQADGRSDVWSIGVILFEALTGTFPHEGDSFSNLVVAIATVPPKSITQVAPHLPQPLLQLVEECLLPRDQRLPSCAELARRIEALLPLPELAALPCARGKNKKALDRPADLQIRSHAEPPGWDPRASTSAAPRVIEEPSTNPTATSIVVSPPVPSLFADPSSAATRPMGTDLRSFASASPAGAPAPPPAAAFALAAPAPPTAARLFGKETTTIHDRSALQRGSFSDGQTQLISVSSAEPLDRHRTARMEAGELPASPRVPFSAPPLEPPRDQLVESVSTLNVERRRSEVASPSGPPPGPELSGGITPIPARGGLGVALAVGGVVALGLVVAMTVFVGRRGEGPPASAAAPVAAADVPPAQEEPSAAPVEPAAVEPPPAAAPSAVSPAPPPATTSSAPLPAAPVATSVPASSAPPPPSASIGTMPWPPPGGARPAAPWKPPKKCDKDDPLSCLDPGF